MIFFSVPSAMCHRVAVGGETVPRLHSFALGEDLRMIIVFFVPMPPFSNKENAVWASFGPPSFEEVCCGGPPEPATLMVRESFRHRWYQARV